MTHPVECPFKICKDVVAVLLVLAVFLIQNSDVEDLFCGNPPPPTPSFVSYSLRLRLRLNQSHTCHLCPGARRKTRSLLTLATTEWYRHWCCVHFHAACLGQRKPGDALPLSGLTTAEILSLGGSPCLRTRCRCSSSWNPSEMAADLHQGLSPSGAVLSPTPHVVWPAS